MVLSGGRHAFLKSSMRVSKLAFRAAFTYCTIIISIFSPLKFSKFLNLIITYESFHKPSDRSKSTILFELLSTSISKREKEIGRL
jgi:hypothetical protein